MMMRVCMCVRKRERVYYVNKFFFCVFCVFVVVGFFTLEGHNVNKICIHVYALFC